MSKPQTTTPKSRNSGRRRPPQAETKQISMRRTLKKLLMDKPTLTTDQITERLRKLGFDAANVLTIQTMRLDTLDTLRVASEASILKVKL